MNEEAKMAALAQSLEAYTNAEKTYTAFMAAELKDVSDWRARRKVRRGIHKDQGHNRIGSFFNPARGGAYGFVYRLIRG